MRIRNAASERTSKRIDCCIYEQKRQSNSMTIQSTESVVYIARGLRFMLWY